MRVHLVNGILTHGESNVDRVGRRLSDQGWDVADIYLPKRSSISARWGGQCDAERIADFSRDGDVLIAHSFGCLRSALAMKHRKYRAVIMFRPAMSKDYEFEYTHPCDLVCIHSKSDWAIFVGAFLLFSPFGLAGRVGFDDMRVENIKSSGGHNADFDDHLDWSVALVSRKLRQYRREND